MSKRDKDCFCLRLSWHCVLCHVYHSVAGRVREKLNVVILASCWQQQTDNVGLYSPTTRTNKNDKNDNNSRGPRRHTQSFTCSVTWIQLILALCCAKICGVCFMCVRGCASNTDHSVHNYVLKCPPNLYDNLHNSILIVVPSTHTCLWYNMYGMHVGTRERMHAWPHAHYVIENNVILV